MSESRPTPERPTSPRREATRARLLDGARQVIADQGVHGASVEAICEAAGFTRGAFYSNFTSRDDLVLAIIADDRARALAEIESVLADPPDDPGEIVAAIQERLAEFDSLRRHLVRTELTLYALRSPAVRPDFVRVRREFREGFRQAIDAAAAAKGLTLLLDTELLVRAVEALHDGATMQSLLEPDALPFGTIQQEVIPRILLEHNDEDSSILDREQSKRLMRADLSGPSMADKLIADRRAEAQREEQPRASADRAR